MIALRFWALQIIHTSSGRAVTGAECRPHLRSWKGLAKDASRSPRRPIVNLVIEVNQQLDIPVLYLNLGWLAGTNRMTAP